MPRHIFIDFDGADGVQENLSLSLSLYGRLEFLVRYGML
jgi:hypothetical protein